MASDVLRDAEAALDAGDSARDVARTYLARADKADVLPQLVALMRHYDGASADSLVVDYLLERRDHGASEPGARHARLLNMADVKPETVRWLWPGRIPLGKLTILDGDPGVLKSTLALDLAARLSRAAAMPDGAEPDVDGPRGTVLLTAEDGPADTIRPRLDAAGADAVRVVGLEAVRTEGGERLPTVDDLKAIREAIEAVDASLVVVDPLVAYLGANVNSYRDQDVRGALAGLVDLADEKGVAVLAIRHLNKSGGDNPLHRGGGSIGLIAAARSGLLVARDPDAPESRRVLASTKSNLCDPPPSLAFRPEPTGNKTVRIAWEGESDLAAGALLERRSGDERTAQEEAADVLREELRDGPLPVGKLQELAKQLGISFKTFRRAKRTIGATAERKGFGKGGKWYWRIGGQQDCPSKADLDMGNNGNGPEPLGGSEDDKSIEVHTQGVSTFGEIEGQPELF